MKKYIILTLLLVAVTSTIFAKKIYAGKRPAPVSVTLNPANWYFDFSVGMPLRPTALSGIPGFWFDLPVHNAPMSNCWETTSCPQVDYLLTPHNVPISGTLVVTVQVLVTSGTPIFNYQTEPFNTGPTPAGVHAIMWSPNIKVPLDSQRWWSNPGVVRLVDATNGIMTMTIPITPSEWSNVNGKRGTYDAATTANFWLAFSTPYRVGMTFGGGSFFGHGVNISGGTAKFVVLDYSFH